MQRTSGFAVDVSYRALDNGGIQEALVCDAQALARLVLLALLGPLRRRNCLECRRRYSIVRNPTISPLAAGER
jgi:hypothetical protein